MIPPNRFELPKERAFTPEEKEERKWFVSYLRELREKITSGELGPETNWDTVWVISGTENDMDGVAEDKKQNQAKERLERGFTLLKEVAAVRVNKTVDALTQEDIEQNAPLLFFNGNTLQDDFLKSHIKSGEITKRYGIPATKIRFPDHDETILNTSHQFDQFPEDILKNSRKIIVVSSWYHCPRIAKYIEKKAREENNTNLPDQMIVYPADVELLRTGRTTGEGKKILDYFKEILMHKKETK